MDATPNSPSFTTVNNIAILFKIDQKDTENWDAYSATLTRLHANGWLLYDDQNDAYKMHQVIQEVARYYLPIEEEELKPLLKIMTDLVFVDDETQDIVERFVWIPYAERLLSIKIDYEQEEVMELQKALAFLYHYQGNFYRAKELLEIAVQNAEMVFEKDHHKIGSYKNMLGGILNLLGKHKEAAAYLEKTLEIDILHYGEGHQETAITQSNLATVYSNLGDHERARDLSKQALASVLKHFGDDHPTVAVYQSNLATVHSDLGDHEHARDLLEQALASDLRNFGKNHPNVATRYNNLIQVYAHFKHWDKAQEACDKNLAICMKIFGAEHPATKRAEGWRAWLQKQMGE